MDIIIVLGFTCTIYMVLKVLEYTLKTNDKVDKILKHLDIGEEKDD